MIGKEFLEVLQVVAFRGNLVGAKQLLGLILLGDFLAFGRVEGFQISVRDPGTVNRSQQSFLQRRKGSLVGKALDATAYNSLVSKNMTGKERSWARRPSSE